MEISKRSLELKNSVTLKLNEKVTNLVENGRRVYNLTAGQLPERPPEGIILGLQSEMNFLKSFQYTPVSGNKELQKKVIEYIETRRKISFREGQSEFSCMISNGAKQSIFNLLGAIINPGDEALILSPYWISYPEMIKLWGGICQKVESYAHNSFVPLLEDIEKKITDKTRVMIVNSPNNPSGLHYPEEWMKGFAKMMQKYPQVTIISDEIYFDLSYFDPSPTCFYQFDKSLLERTVVVEGVSKSLALTGMRIGYAIGPKKIIDAAVKIQGQTTSGANSLVQRALLEFNFKEIENFLRPINSHLRSNAQILKNKLEEKGLSRVWYQPQSAFYFLIDFKATPLFAKYKAEKDNAVEICEDLLEKWGVAVVPGTDFGIPNTGRISLVLEETYFTEAVELIVNFLSN